MPNTITEMIHAPDVAATVAWYQTPGFRVVNTNDCDGTIDWALLAFGDGRLMVNADGHQAGGDRRDADLFVAVDDVDGLYQQLKGRVDIGDEPAETFYGTREFALLDPNGFRLTFSQTI